MSDLTIRTRIIAACSLIVAILVGLGVVSYSRLQQIRGAAVLLEVEALAGMLSSGEIRSSAQDLLPAILLHETATDAAARSVAAARMDTVLATLGAQLTEYGRTVADDEDGRIFAAIRASKDRFSLAYQRAIQDGALASREVDAELRPALRQLRALSDSLVANNRRNGREAAHEIIGSVSSSLRLLMIAIIAATLVAPVCAWMFVRQMQEGLARLMSVTQVMRAGDFRQRVVVSSRDELGQLGGGINQMADDLANLIARVQQSGVEVNSSATEIAATSRQQQATATEIAATTSEVGATASRISATSKELVRTMNEVVQVADQAAALAEGGQGGLQRMGSSMQQISEASALINSRLALLSEKAANIGLVVTTINKVADQTNLLSLNAAIEAEKAGEHGRGFAVVAREIRRLADQTAGATFDIEQLVKEMQSAVSAGVMGMDKFSDEVRRGGEVIGQVTSQLSEIIVQVQTLTPSFEAVSEGVKSQSVSAGQISEALSQLSVAAQQTADSLRQSNRAIDQLNDAARGLQSGVSHFTLAG
ncbi:MAG: chemotaxis protein [Gemmatimonadetes bacterium]|nr:chemotaxis protein [Gemmatimonadota bacterium]